jgi:hypothetical protein
MFRAALRYLAITAVVAVVLTSQTVFAKGDVGLRLTPLRTYQTQNPGTSDSGSLTLTNLTASTQTVTLSSEVFKVTGQQYDYDFEPTSTANWVQFADKQIILTPNQKQDVAYSIAVPVNGTPGGHYFALIASTQSLPEKGRIMEVHRVASLVYLEVSGAIIRQSHLVNVELPWFTSKTIVPVSTLIANTGNTHALARVSIDAQRQPRGSAANLSQAQNLIMPSTVRKIDSQVSLPGLPGLYAVNLTYAPPQGSANKSTHYVLYVPIWTQIVIVAMVAFFGWYIWDKSRSKKRASY